MTYINILLLTFIVVFIVDLSGFSDTLTGAVSRWLHVPVRELPPFTCSLCMTFWVGLIYASFTDFTVPVLAFVCLCAFLSFPTARICLFVRERILQTIERWTRKRSSKP